ncbi:Hint domain-containing protein [Nereida sp. MMG025]|uniref:Hint domain-containing protein n=1 Tax=Nereida sp. MMG025 TaxID=2909981 RepID=UPI001F4866B3|nr:Hint domain-containing protein [Nereida sp. MMG025]MCF6446093.1 hypothetical protein [Nereida sp. MMG025]
MTLVPENFTDFDVAQIDNFLNSTGFDTSGYNVIGIYGQVSVTLGEGIAFLGYDVNTQQIVSAAYVGVVISAGSDVIGSVGGGVFGFTGNPIDMAGWSYGAGAAAGVSQNISYTALDEGVAYMQMLGASTSLGVEVGSGFTYSVVIDGEPVFYWGLLEEETTFGLSQYSDAITQVVQTNGRVLVEWSIEVDGQVYNVEQTIAATAWPSNSNTTYGMLRTTVTDNNGNKLFSDDLAQIGYSGFVSSQAVKLFEDGTIETGGTQCFPAGTPITLADGSTKPIEQITQSDVVLTHDAQGNPTAGIVDKLFTNTTSEFIRLTFDDGRDDLVATPGHRFLTETGDYMEIGHMFPLCGGKVQFVSEVTFLFSQ